MTSRTVRWMALGRTVEAFRKPHLWSWCKLRLHGDITGCQSAGSCSAAAAMRSRDKNQAPRGGSLEAMAASNLIAVAGSLLQASERIRASRSHCRVRAASTIAVGPSLNATIPASTKTPALSSSGLAWGLKPIAWRWPKASLVKSSAAAYRRPSDFCCYGLTIRQSERCRTGSLLSNMIRAGHLRGTPSRYQSDAIDCGLWPVESRKESPANRSRRGHGEPLAERYLAKRPSYLNCGAAFS